MPLISACVISYNEETKIADCLESLKGVADEIVVVDSCSTDATRSIALNYTNRVIEQPFLGYIEQKNFAVEQASNDWILALDCDERLSPELRNSIIRFKDNAGKAHGYRVSRKTFYIYRWLNHCWYPDRKVRLFNRRRAQWGGRNPHDHVVVASEEIADLDGDLLHYSFDSVSDHLQTIDRFTDIGAREAHERGKRASLFSPYLHGIGTFTKQYFLKAGFLDGFAGLTASTLSGVHAYVKYVKLRLMAKRAESAPE